MLARAVFELVSASSAQARLDAASAFVRSFAPGTELLLVGATRDAIDDLVRGLPLARGASFGLHRFSLAQLAAQLAAVPLAEQGLVPASALGAEVLAAHCAFEAVRDGALQYFTPVVQLPGFGRALARTLNELRLARVAPDGLTPLGARGADLARLLARYDERLRSSKLADRAALFGAATQALRLGASLQVGLPLLLLDVELASPIERELVHALCAAAPAVLATVPAGDEAALAAYARGGQLQALGSAAGTAVGAVQGDPHEELRAGAATPREPIASSLTRLRAHLFSDGTPPAGELDASVRMFSAPGEARESVEIARFVLDEARAGVPFDQMTVLLRNPESYAPLLQTAFRRAGIPAYFARGTRLPDAAGRALLALLACRAENLSARRFAEYLSFAQTPLLDADGAPASAQAGWTQPVDDALGSAAGEAPDGEREAAADAAAQDAAAGTERELRAPWRWEALLVDAAVINSEQRWARRLAGLEQELALRRDEAARVEPDSPAVITLTRQLAELARLRRFALPVIERLAALPERALWGEWLSQLNGLAPWVLRRPERVLRVLAELAPLAEVGPIALEEVQSVLGERLGFLEQDPPAQRYGRVYVAPPELVRGRSFARVFVPGLAERMFPQRPREDPLLLDADRERLGAELGAELTTQLERARRERLLLRLCVGAARERVYLSYPRVETVEGRPRVTSFYGLDVVRATTGKIPDPESFERDAAAEANARLAWPAPPDAARAIDAVEHDLAMLWPLLHSREAAAHVEGRARYLLELNAHLGRSLRTRFARWELRRWNEHDGLVRRTPELAAALDARRLAARAYSVSALERYAVCPYKFLLSAVLGLAPRKSLAPQEGLDPLTRGNLLHRVQAETLRALGERGLLPLEPERTTAAEALLDATLADVAEEFRDRLDPPIRRVWDDELAVLRSDLIAWLRMTADASAVWQPKHFELGFGLPKGAGRDPTSQPEPVAIAGGALLRGVVDLIEASSDGSALRVTDYKTGAADTKEGLIIGGGERLQPVLYGLASEVALGRPVHEGRLFYCTTRGGFSERVVPLDARAREAGALVLRVVDGAIADGFLPPAPRKDACARCDFRAICGPYEEERAQRKDQQPLAALKNLRELP